MLVSALFAFDATMETAREAAIQRRELAKALVLGDLTRRRGAAEYCLVLC